MAACSESRNPYFKAFVVVAIETAMRRGEMLSLQRQHIDFEARTAFLPDTKMATIGQFPCRIGRFYS